MGPCPITEHLKILLKLILSEPDNKTVLHGTGPGMQQVRFKDVSERTS